MKSLNWKLIILLSMLGLAMGLATVVWISPNNEPLLWFIIFPVCAYLISKKAGSKYFLHGLFLGLANCVWITSAHIIFVEAYLKYHPQEAYMMSNANYSPQVMMLMTGPVIGIVSGAVFGLFAVVLSKILKKAELNKQRREEANNK